MLYKENTDPKEVEPESRSEIIPIFQSLKPLFYLCFQTPHCGFEFPDCPSHRMNSEQILNSNHQKKVKQRRKRRRQVQSPIGTSQKPFTSTNTTSDCTCSLHALWDLSVAQVLLSEVQSHSRDPNFHDCTNVSLELLYFRTENLSFTIKVSQGFILKHMAGGL